MEDIIIVLRASLTRDRNNIKNKKMKLKLYINENPVEKRPHTRKLYTIDYQETALTVEKINKRWDRTFESKKINATRKIAILQNNIQLLGILIKIEREKVRDKVRALTKILGNTYKDVKEMR